MWADQPAAGKVAEAAVALDLPLPEEGEYVSELNLASRAWVAEWAARLDQGAMLLVDYGYPRTTNLFTPLQGKVPGYSR